MICQLKTKFAVIGATLLIIVIVALAVGLTLGLQQPEIRGGAVTAVTKECVDIGVDILRKNGSAADAAIAALFCDGATTPQSMGLGGGFLLTIYTKSTGTVETLIARETAPVDAFEDMFRNVSQVTGALSIAVPGELKGYWELHTKYGKLPWATLVRPTINLCQQGFKVSKFLATVMKRFEDLIMTSIEYSKIFVDPLTGQLYNEGDTIKRPRLAETLELIATEGADTLYTQNGTIGRLLIDELQTLGGIIKMQDLIDYRVLWQEPYVAKVFDNKTLYTAPLPGSGSVLVFILNFVNNFLPLDKSGIFFHRIIESFKFAYARRTKLGDPFFVPEAVEVVKNLTDPAYAAEIRTQHSDSSTSQDFNFYGASYSSVEDHGTAHISVLAPNGDAVSVTSTINTSFGSKILSPSTGIILNDQMDDFSTPGITNAYGLEASPANYIVPGKRPLSSMCPTIIIDANGDVQMIVGAAGGPKITTSVAITIIRHLFLNESLSEAVNSARLHHQLAPMLIEHEGHFPLNVLEYLLQIGHVLREVPNDEGFAAVTAISRDINGNIAAVSDSRRNGSVSIF